MLKFGNVTTPFTAFRVLVPDNVPGMSNPPFVAIAIVTGPVRPVGLPDASSATTFTAGWIVMNGSVVLGWTENASCVAAGRRTRTLASQVLGAVKYHVHCGSTEPALARTA